MKKHFGRITLAAFLTLSSPSNQLWAGPDACRNAQLQYDLKKEDLFKQPAFLYEEFHALQEVASDCIKSLKDLIENRETLQDRPSNPALEAAIRGMQSQIDQKEAECSRHEQAVLDFEQELERKVQRIYSEGYRELTRIQQQLRQMRCNHPCEGRNGYCFSDTQGVQNVAAQTRLETNDPTGIIGQFSGTCRYKQVIGTSILTGCIEHYNAGNQVRNVQAQCRSLSELGIYQEVAWSQERCSPHSSVGVCTRTNSGVASYVQRSFSYDRDASIGEQKSKCLNQPASVWENPESR